MGSENLWDPEKWNELMKNEEWMYEDDKYTATFEDLRDKFDSAIGNIRQMTFKNMKGRIEEGVSEIAEKAKKTDTAKILKEIVEDIIPKIDEIKELIGYLETIQKEIDSRSIENPEMEMMENEIKELESWKAYGKDVKQLVAEIALDIGKRSLIGAGKIGKNIIGGTIIGAIKLGKNIKDFTAEKKFKINDAKSKSKIQEKRDEIKNKKFYDIVTEDEEYDEDEIYYDLEEHDEDEIYYDLEEHDVEEYDNVEEYYNDNELDKDDNFAKRTIRGIKEFYKEKSAKFTWIKDKESRQAFINRQKEKIQDAIKNTDTYRNTVRIGKEVKYNYEVTKGKIETKAKDIHKKTTEIYKDTKKKATDRYEDTKKKFELNKTTALRTVLENGAKFAKKMLSAIEPQLQSQTEKEDKLRKEVESKSHKNDVNMNKDTLEK